jgi:serine/threonine-protein kinase
VEDEGDFLRVPAADYAAPLLDRVAKSLALLPGHRLGAYEIERELGRGGMATIYLAHDLRQSRLVAVKVLRPELAAAVGVKRFLREIDIAARMQHPHILPLLDSGRSPTDRAERVWYVMPYVEGESLRARLARERRLPLEDALRITRQVAAALGHAHGHGIIHRDIKPENILLEEDEAVVADFGIARAITGALEEIGGQELTQSGIVLGTTAYMSPEQTQGERDLDQRTDIYSLGCVLYEMLAGEPPFSGTGARLPEGVPQSVERAVTTALSRARTDRFATVEEFVAAFGPPPTR